MQESSNFKSRVAIIGAGPAGLTAAWRLKDCSEIGVSILEADKSVGGISKTVRAQDWMFDLGGHRFFSKSTRVNWIWEEMLAPEIFLERPRQSRIYYKGKFFDYPLKPLNALFNLGVLETFRCIASYVIVKINPPKNQETFEDWVAARFGWRLYRIFFKTYTEKVWGISTRQLQSTWAAQRIKSLSLLSALKDAFGIGNRKEITTLISHFKYPEYGPGQLWESAANKIVNLGIDLKYGESICSVNFQNEFYSLKSANGNEITVEAVFSSLPLAIIPELLNAPSEILDAGARLRFRDFIIVALPIELTESIFSDNWIYVHDDSVKVGRIQNYGSWSPSLVRTGTTCLGLEYFVNIGNELWNSSDELLIQNAIQELKILGIEARLIENSGFVVRVEKAYPVYDETYLESVATIRDWLKTSHPNWFQIGRNGQHRYNNQDHSMLSALYAVEEYLGFDSEDYWNVNLDDDYHETSKETRNSPIFQNTKH